MSGGLGAASLVACRPPTNDATAFHDGSRASELAQKPGIPESGEATSGAADGSLAQEFRIGGGVVALSVSGDPPLAREAVVEWVRTAARAVTAYYGHFPVPRVELDVVFDRRGRIHGGLTSGGRHIDIHVGRDTARWDLDNDWMLTHEMFHLAFPDMGEEHLWMNEGASTYLEPVARVQIGNLDAAEMWRQCVEGMPQGLPEPGDRGLDRTHSWGRTYWGGAIFWLLADVRIREQTHNRLGLEDALRAILRAGGDGSEDWSVARVVDVGDRATGTTVLRDLYDQMARSPAPAAADLDSLWGWLGVRDVNGRVTLDDAAPLAAVRRAITARPPDQIRSTKSE